MYIIHNFNHQVNFCFLITVNNVLSTVTVKPATIHGILQTIHKSLLDLELKKDKQQADLAVKFVAKATTSFILHIKVKKYIYLNYVYCNAYTYL